MEQQVKRPEWCKISHLWGGGHSSGVRQEGSGQQRWHRGQAWPQQHESEGVLVRDWGRAGHPRALGAAPGTSTSLTVSLASEDNLLQLSRACNTRQGEGDLL